MILLRNKLSTSITAAVSAAPPLSRLLQLALSRFYSKAGAALPQLEPDYSHYHYGGEDDEQNLSDRLVLAPMTDAEVAFPGKGVRWVFIGSLRSKKHLYADMLSKLLEVPLISMATLVRQELSPRSSLYKQIADAVNNGKLVPEEIIFGLLSKRLKDGYYRGESGFVLDGIPRTQMQARILDQLSEIDLVLNFKCTEDQFLNGNGEGCWKKKLQAYAERIKALEDYYRKQRKLVDFQVRSAPAETWRCLLSTLHLQHINAFWSSKKLMNRSTSQT